MNTKGKKPKRKVKMDYGDGSIYFVKSRNCYAGQVYLEIDGEKIRKSVYGKTERIVKDKIRELQIQAKAGAFKKVDKTTFYDLAEKMMILRNDGELLKNIALAGSKRAETYFDRPIMLKNILDDMNETAN